MQNHDSQYDPSACIHFRELMTGVNLCSLKERSYGNPDCSPTTGQIRKKLLHLQRAQGAMCPSVIPIVLTFNLSLLGYIEGEHLIADYKPQNWDLLQKQIIF